MKTRDGGITEKEYLTVVFCRPRSLIAAAAETGAVLAGADPATRKSDVRVGKVGRDRPSNWSTTVLTSRGTEKSLGKRPLQDLREGR